MGASKLADSAVLPLAGAALLGEEIPDTPCRCRFAVGVQACRQIIGGFVVFFCTAIVIFTDLIYCNKETLCFRLSNSIDRPLSMV